MLKYFFHLFLFILLINCDNGHLGHSPYPQTPRPPNPNINQSGQCFYGYLEDIHHSNYEFLLADSPQITCGKTRGDWLINKEVYVGASACKNWTGIPNVEISFNMQFTSIQTLQITPRGNGGGIYKQQGIPGLFRANAPISPQNEDKGWNAIIPMTGYRGGKLELYCKKCDFNEDDFMSIEILYRDRPIGTLRVNPQSTLARCQSTTPSAYPAPYPHAY